MQTKEQRLRSWKFWLGFIVSAGCLWWALQGLDWQDFTQALREANYWWIVPGVLVYCGAVLVRTWRWHYMLAHIKRIPTLRLFPIVVIGYMGNNVYPARAGELLRSYVLRRKEGVAMSSSLTTVILERLFDGLVMLLFVAVTLPFAPLPPVYRDIVIGFSLLFGIALLVFFVLATRPTFINALYERFVERLLPAALRPRVRPIFERAIIGLQSLRSPRDTVLIFASSALIWLTETAKYWFVMQAFPFEVSFPVLMLMTAIVNLFTTIPSTPGYVGTFDAPGIGILTQFGVAHAIAAGYTIVLHVALWLPITLLGIFYMLRESIGWHDIDRAASQEEPSLTDPPPELAPAEVGTEQARTEHDDITSGVSL
jgi:hypothetical protein